MICSRRFIVLEHDLFEITVDLAVGYTLNAALTHNPPFTVSPFIEQFLGVITKISATSARANWPVHENPYNRYVHGDVDEPDLYRRSQGRSQPCERDIIRELVYDRWCQHWRCYFQHCLECHTILHRHRRGCSRFRSVGDIQGVGTLYLGLFQSDHLALLRPSLHIRN